MRHGCVTSTSEVSLLLSMWMNCAHQLLSMQIHLIASSAGPLGRGRPRAAKPPVVSPHQNPQPTPESGSMRRVQTAVGECCRCGLATLTATSWAIGPRHPPEMMRRRTPQALLAGPSGMASVVLPPGGLLWLVVLCKSGMLRLAARLMEAQCLPTKPALPTTSSQMSRERRSPQHRMKARRKSSTRKRRMPKACPTDLQRRVQLVDESRSLSQRR
mmetsp:Transcript_52629/g.125734  ORF Transcript_52629/g.125734 Transcript_52629/m.125734 type:complete len:215 (+) Transcript_52629:1388-2032(+)